MFSDKISACIFKNLPAFHFLHETRTYVMLRFSHVYVYCEPTDGNLVFNDSFAARDVRETYEFQIGSHLTKPGYQLGGSIF